MEYLSFIKDAYSEDTGGGLECDVLHLNDGTVLAISEEAVVLYSNIAAWEEGQGAALATIFRATAYPEEG